MSGRVSIKGQGADIFFGAAGPESSKHPDHATEPSDVENTSLRDAAASSAESKPASKPAGQPDSKQDSLPASKHASTQVPKPGVFVRLDRAAKRRLRELLERDHRTHNTYRYRDEELAAVRDIVYELEVRWARKVTRNDVMRSAVLWAIEDYKEHGEGSFLVQLFKEGD